ncbi:MAG: alpha-amylase family glycosyl hydrolase, partial [Chloroflexota bacterium]|nr:alpha-amylase family glycosyl hydrolase [Chloroflexota bacterium]
MKTYRKSALILLLFAIFLAACAPRLPATVAPTFTVVPATPTSTPTSEPDPVSWWQDRVFYEIFVRSFKDSDGDGIGDFQGIIQQLDYLNDGDPTTHDDLGVGALWLMPINPSPSYHGYDVTDYTAVNPDYGTMDDFKQLLAEAEKRDIKVIIDLVLNHTSTEHPWFQASQDPESPFHDWYVWSDTKPQTPGPWSQTVWHRNAANNLYYYGVFWDGMPDLNYDNPDVRAEMLDVTKFWLEEVGVDGFRVDAARYLFAEGSVQQDTESTIAWFEDWRDFYKAIDPETFSVGEVWTNLQVTAKYSEGMDSLFMFDLAEDIKNGVYAADSARIVASYQDVLTYFPDGNFSAFLSNHDQQRVMSLYGRNVEKAKLAALVYLTGPGTPFIYYGEEIGMTGNKPDENLRRPMQWTDDARGGFTTGTPWQPLEPDFEEVNLALQNENPNTLLNHYRRLIHLRNAHPALRGGEYLPLSSSCRQVYAVLRLLEEDALLIIA